MRARTKAVPRVTHKMLGNCLHVGMIHLCLPDAIILDVRRDAIDNCLASHERQVRTRHAFTCDLRALAAHYRRHGSVKASWDKVLPARVVRIRYEDLVARSDGSMRRLLDVCGLPGTTTGPGFM